MKTLRDAMFAWFSVNLINIALVALLVLIVALLIRGMVRDRKAGKSACGGCGKCVRESSANAHWTAPDNSSRRIPHEQKSPAGGLPQVGRMPDGHVF